jgi:hypothetical protein
MLRSIERSIAAVERCWIWPLPDRAEDIGEAEAELIEIARRVYLEVVGSSGLTSDLLPRNRKPHAFARSMGA